MLVVIFFTSIILFSQLWCPSTDGLAAAGNAPKVFLKTSRNGLPYVSVVFCSLFVLLGYMASSSGAGRVFGWFANMTAIAGLMTWFGISFTYIRFYKGLKAQGFDRKTLPFSSRLQPFAAYYAAFSCILISIVRPHAFFFFPFAGLNSNAYSWVDGQSSLKEAGQRTPLSPTTSH